ncbi:hypothetical protein D2E22_1095 [Bifidobacterium castoris]|uniref:Uncharacterized protein n=1 Tax=Bifidobacterium castoris TaxID=2306972 RepID=A0A430F8C1_9BIFI|nr:hypothetical protein [Bifidobacterium castoris]RSX48957.1 hypothetical protein D2E22_1095 [Bifidobacterium castoris]
MSSTRASAPASRSAPSASCGHASVDVASSAPKTSAATSTLFVPSDAHHASAKPIRGMHQPTAYAPSPHTVAISIHGATSRFAGTAHSAIRGCMSSCSGAVSSWAPIVVASASAILCGSQRRSAAASGPETSAMPRTAAHDSAKPKSAARAGRTTIAAIAVHSSSGVVCSRRPSSTYPRASRCMTTALVIDSLGTRTAVSAPTATARAAATAQRGASAHEHSAVAAETSSA